MTTEVTKFSVYDPRVVQTKPKYAVEKGALSLTNVSFNAQTANSSAQQFNVIVPSENVFIDRAVEWISGGVIQIPVTFSSAPTTGCPLMTYNDIALAAFPSHQTVAQMTATINDATVTVNTQDVLANVLRLQDLEKHRKQRTCPTMLDTYAYNYPPNSQSIAAPAILNSPQGGYGQRYSTGDSPNGAWSQFWFCDSAGAPLLAPAAATATATTSSTAVATSNVGLPLTTGTASGVQNVYVRWQSSEHLLLPPFIFGDAFELSTGLFGVQNFQVQMNLTPTPQRAIRLSTDLQYQTVGGQQATYGTPAWATLSTAYSPNVNQPSLSVQFLTPALDVPLPPKSIVPYMEFPRYITTGLPLIPSTLGTAVNSKGVSSSSTVITTNTITLPNIPDLIMIYLKPASAGQTGVFTNPAYTTSTGVAGPTTFDSTIADFTLPIQAISINFDNFSGLLANHTQYQLYKMSVNNGVDMDFPSWCGESRERQQGGAYTSISATSSTTATYAIGSPFISTVGGPLVLRPGRDFALQAGQAPGLVGNFTFQANVTVGNQFATSIAASGVNLYIVPVSSGFFETIKGSSRIIKGVLTEQDILGSAAHAPERDLERPVGAGKKGNKMGAYC